MNGPLDTIMAVLIWPGLIGGALLAWLLLWIQRKVIARGQGRRGPPFYQPFFDFIKLAGKEVVVPHNAARMAFYALPVISLAAVTGAIALLPFPGSPLRSFGGDLIFMLFLLEVPLFINILAGHVSHSLYAEVGASREAMLSLSFNLPFLAAVLAIPLQVGSFRLADLAGAPLTPVYALVALVFVIVLPAMLQMNPFSLPNAEQEIIEGPYMEYGGPLLALFHLSRGLRLVALSGLFAVLFMPRVPDPFLTAAGYLAVMVVLVGVLSAIAVATARSNIHRAFRFYWMTGTIIAVFTIIIAVVR
jgi:NADH-quinone oxidoreductase subunit H